MKTGEDVRGLGLYSSDCCSHEMLFDSDDCFSRCPRCLRLCEWERVDLEIPPQEMSQSKDHEFEAA